MNPRWLQKQMFPKIKVHQGKRASPDDEAKKAVEILLLKLLGKNKKRSMNETDILKETERWEEFSLIFSLSSIFTFI